MSRSDFDPYRTDPETHPAFFRPPTLLERTLNKTGIGVLETIAKRTRTVGGTCNVKQLPRSRYCGSSGAAARTLADLGLIQFEGDRKGEASRLSLTDEGWKHVDGGKPLWMELMG